MIVEGWQVRDLGDTIHCRRASRSVLIPVEPGGSVTPTMEWESGFGATDANGDRITWINPRHVAAIVQAVQEDRL